MRKKRFAILVFAVTAIMSLVVLTLPARAEGTEVNDDEVLAHINAYILHKCYTTDGILKSPIKAEDVVNVGSVMQSDAQIFNALSVNIPGGIKGNTDTSIPCNHMTGTSTKLSIIDRMYKGGNIDVNDATSRSEYYVGMGYKNNNDAEYIAEKEPLEMYKTAYAFLTNKAKSEAVKMTEFDDEILYYIYVKYYLKKYEATVMYTECVSADDGEESYIPVIVGSAEEAKWQWCKIYDYDKKKTDSIPIGLPDVSAWAPTSQTLSTLVQRIRALDIANMDMDRIKEKLATEYTPAQSLQPQEGEGSKTDECYENAESLGWVFCPIIDAMKDFIIRKYGEWIEPALRMDTKLFKWGDESQNGTYRAWAIFRDIGNFAFIVIFIFVIFSQITGLGIDNYGVKKALPKVLIAALLINLSFIICQAAVDVSNIAGDGVAGLFQGIKQQITIDSVKVEGVTVNPGDTGAWQDTKTWGTSFSSNFLGNSAVVIVVTAISIGAVVSQGLAILIPVVLLLISIAVSIITLIAILGIRQAAAVLLVVVSPLAFACYILPNTKKLFDKWFESFKGMLVAFPICSALVYGGDMAGTILLKAADDNTWVLISAAIISIAPIFIIPKVISKSMGALSGGMMNLGNRLGNWGKGKARNRMENSFMTNRRNYNQQMRQQRVAAAAGKYNAKRGLKTTNKLRNKSNLNTWQRRKYNAAMGMTNAYNNDSTSAYNSAFVGRSDDYITGEILKAGNQRKPDANMIVAGLSSIKDEDKRTAAIRKLAETGALDKIKKDDPNSYSRIANVMASSKDSVINQSIGKLMAKGETVQEMYSSGSLRAKVQGAGTSVMASQNKDVFKTEGAAELFSDDQLRAGLTAGYSGATAAAFYDMMRDVSDDRKKNIVDGMSAEDATNLSSATVIMKTSDGKEYEAEVGSMAALGAQKKDPRLSEQEQIAKDADAFARGAALVRKKDEEAGTDDNNKQVNALKGEEGRELRPTMQGKVMDALHVEHTGNENPNKSSISSGINVNDMSEDDYNYIQWQHDRNSGSNTETASAEGGTDIPHGDAGGGSSTPTPTPAPAPATSEKPDDKSSPTRVLYGDGYKIEIGEEAANSDRAKYTKALEDYNKAHPRGENETSTDYYKRLEQPSFEQWKKDGMGEIKLPEQRKATPANNAEPKPVTPEPAIIIPHESTPNPDGKIITGSEAPEHPSEIITEGAKPNPNAHIDTPGDKPNPDGKIITGSEAPEHPSEIITEGAKPNPNAHINLDTHSPVPPVTGTSGKPGAQSHYRFDRKYTPSHRNFGGTGSGAEGTGASYNSNRRGK